MAHIKTNSIDKFGIWTSSLCALHCLLLPVILPIVPLVSASFFAEEWFEQAILIVSVAIGFLGLFIGFYKYHRRIYPLYALALGAMVYWNKDIFGHSFESLAVVLGAIIIIAAHTANLKLCKSCQDCDHSDKA